MGTTSQLACNPATDAFNERDLDRLADVLADDAFLQAPGGTGGEGRDACVAFYRGLLTAFPDARFEVRDVHVADDVTVEEGTFTGTRRRTGQTDRSVALDYVQVLRFRDGKQVWCSLTLDRLLMLEQLGLIADAAQPG